MAQQRQPHAKCGGAGGRSNAAARSSDAQAGTSGSKAGTSGRKKNRAPRERAQRPTAPGKPRAARAPRATGDFIEGRRAAAEALRVGFPIKRALVAEGEPDATLGGLVDELKAAGIVIRRVARTELDERSSHGSHQGIMLEVGAFPYADLSDVVARAQDGPALVVVLDHVTDAGNFGAIARSAEVVGAAGVVIANRRAAEVNVGAYKTSAGAVMHLPIARVPNIARALDELKEAGFWVIGASEHAEQTCWEMSLAGRIALVMGSEGEGISRLVLETCDGLTRLPQRGKTESLNVAQAATALCYEWLRCNSQ